MGTERGLWDEFSTYLRGRDIDPGDWEKSRPRDFEEIGDRCRTRRGYTALVYGDGNALGRIVKEIAGEDLFGRFSAALDRAVREACYEALWKHCKRVDGKLPADILMLGGDDLIVYMSADTALPFAVHAARLFEEKTKKALCSVEKDSFFRNKYGDHGLTLSMGISFGRSHTPISIMADQAEELLKLAKKRGSTLAGGDYYTPACIDFHMTSQFNQVGVEDGRRHLTLKTAANKPIRLYHGPYTLDEAETLVERAIGLNASGLPTTRLHGLREAPFKGKVNGTIETLTIYGRCRNSAQKMAVCKALDEFDCFEVMPWKKERDGISTVLVDLVEIAGLTSLNE
jgi:hypothetical protein